MKREKYTYKNHIPKTLKKKSKLKIKKMRDFDWKIQSNFLKSKNNSLFNGQKRNNVNKLTSKSTWKLRSALFMLSVLITVLILPTLIVVPFIKGEDSNNAEQIESEQVSGVEQTVSPFSVAVKRSNSDAIENVPLEEYVLGVVASEMPADFEVEALKAQGLAARTYIVNHLLYQNNDEDWDVSDTVQHQVYQNPEDLKKVWGTNYTTKMQKLAEAVKATEGEILNYENKPITPAFFSTSNGFTENSEDYWANELPYLRSVESPWDESSPKFLDQKVFTVDQIKNELGVDVENGSTINMEIMRTESNRVKELNLAGITFSGREIREKLQLNSSDFTVKQNSDHLVFTTKGYGHGIGMSQYGANGMAKEGKSYEEIVSYYYKDVNVSNVSDIAPALVIK